MKDLAEGCIQSEQSSTVRRTRRLLHLRSIEVVAHDVALSGPGEQAPVGIIWSRKVVRPYLPLFRVYLIAPSLPGIGRIAQYCVTVDKLIRHMVGAGRHLCRMRNYAISGIDKMLAAQPSGCVRCTLWPRVFTLHHSKPIICTCSQ